MPAMLEMFSDQIFTLPDVEQTSQIVGHTVRSDSIRSQMANYVNSGLLERVAQGKFRFTEKGKTTFSELSGIM